MRNKIIGLVGVLTLMMALPVVAQDDLRQMTVIVRPEIDKNSKNFTLNYSLFLAREGYRSASREVNRSSFSDGFGTGFVCKSPTTNEKVILTNHHVVGQSEYVTIEILTADGDTTKYEHMAVLASSEVPDLAVVECPDKALPAFNISDVALQDGTNVYTTGYPGIGHKPAWQFGQGIVSNSKFFDATLTNDKAIPVIQHTANVDAGNSGGPLLVKDSKSACGYSVVGINTWKVRFRENTNISISAKSINKFLKGAPTSVNKIGRSALVKAAQDLTSQDYKEIADIISDDYLFENANDNYGKLFNACPEDFRSAIVDSIKNDKPLDALRLLYGYLLKKEIDKQRLAYSDVKYDADSTLQIAKYGTAKGKEQTTYWRQSVGRYKLVSYGEMAKSGKKRSSTHTNISTKNKNGTPTYGIDQDYEFKTIAVEYAKSTEKDNYRRYSFVWKADYRYGYVAVGGGISSIPVIDIDYYNDTTYVTNKGFTPFARLGAQLPVRLNMFYVVPSVGGEVGVNINKEPSALYGMNFNLRLGWSTPKTTYSLSLLVIRA